MKIFIAILSLTTMVAFASDKGSGKGGDKGDKGKDNNGSKGKDWGRNAVCGYWGGSMGDYCRKNGGSGNGSGGSNNSGNSGHHRGADYK